ncbi:peptidoglycan editing factor PgeF [Aureimonas fodinaquatilis]|uniref:Purine nucleoside phosphorylase n=2 Tax=Aureimonas fodinaquatilis TaxID=2565783 RepID=A0A5B0DZH8_9HYPH|nr:peptidoglycan editing factor PgeF [Aureimonas fodinaquatilis]KAA0971778.1 peptidoglycan editing factor PgeF [Aureimonas fodinaquatilis]
MLNCSTESTPPLRDEDIILSPQLAALDGIRHAFFTRRGGVSEGIYHGLNAGAGSDDNAESVRQNRHLAATYLGVPDADIATPWQFHSADVVIADAPFASPRPRADAVVSNTPGVAIGVVTADCGPILFADRDAGVIGAAHAGWRGAIGGVLQATIATMENLGAARQTTLAILGPTITRRNYEVGAEMRAQLVTKDQKFERFFTPGVSADKFQFDLPAFIVATLENCGVQADFVEQCTYQEPDWFFSYRRTTHRGEADYGRQLSAIVLER